MNHPFIRSLSISLDRVYEMAQVTNTTNGQSVLESSITNNNNNKTAVIDYASPNMAKELHVGHLRSIVIGDALARILERAGYRVTRLSHVGDFGPPLAAVIAWLIRSLDAASSSGNASAIEKMEHRLSPSSLSDIYRKAKKLLETDKDFAAETQRVCLSMQRASSSTNEFDRTVAGVWNAVCKVSRAGVQAMLDRLEVDGRLEERGESWYRDALPLIIEELLARNLATVAEDGAVVVTLDPLPSSASSSSTTTKTPSTQDKSENATTMTPRQVIVRKRDGAYLYASTDLAALKQRMMPEFQRQSTTTGRTIVERAGSFDRAVYLTDSSQSGHFAALFEIGHKMQWIAPHQQCQHITFGVVLGADGGKLKSREGNVPTLQELLDTAEDRTRELVRERAIASRDTTATMAIDSNLNDATTAATATATATTDDASSTIASFDDRVHRIAMSAIKYQELSHHRAKNYSFSIDRMLQLKGNTVLYLFYALSRISSVVNRANSAAAANIKTHQSNDTREDLALAFEHDLAHWNDVHVSERDLAVSLVHYTSVLEDAERNLTPHSICEHLYETASNYHRFYESCRISDTNVSDSTRRRRLALCHATRVVLVDGLGLLGIAPLSLAFATTTLTSSTTSSSSH